MASNVSKCGDINSDFDASNFLCGVCEGFYGKPWTTEQRKDLFFRMEKMHLNTYLYAPKDDYKHRLHWRTKYTDDEAEELASLVKAAQSHNVNFVYALSPGLDITFSDKDDIQALKEKLKQVSAFGCPSFALLFDDIDVDLCSEDEKVYKSPAHAQAAVTNEVYKALSDPDTFLFCPTEYCTSRTVPDLAKSEYLQTLGVELHPKVDILWTGPKVVSKRICPEAIKEMSSIIKRKPVIWDNLHANDYDQTRLFLGPYDGRPPELRNCLGGVLTNPNCEFEANFIAMHTLAQWGRNKVENYNLLSMPTDDSQCSDVEMETEVPEKPDSGYQPKAALFRAIQDWIPFFYQAKGTSKCGTKKNSPKKAKMKSDSAQADSSGGDEKKNSNKKKIEALSYLETHDLGIMVDLFYLPFEHGAFSVHLLKEAHWLVNHSGRVKDCGTLPKSEQSTEVQEWYDRAIMFHQAYKDIAIMVDRFVNIPNRVLLYELYSYISDMRSVISMINAYVKWNGMGRPDKEPFKGGEQEPWIYRGGLHAELRRLLPLEGQNDMFPPPNRDSPAKRVFTVRPYFHDDKDEVYAVCRKTYDDGLDGSDLFQEHPDLIADESIGALLQLYREFCFVLEDDSGVCGYVVSTPNVRNLRNKLADEWFPKMRAKYPKPEKDDDLSTEEDTIRTFYEDVPPLPSSVFEKHPGYVQMAVLSSRIENTSTARTLLNCALKSLKQEGCSGVHTTIQASHINILALNIKLGFEDITNGDTPPEMLYLGQAI